MISYGKQTIDEDDINSVIEVLKSDFLTQGPTVPLLEENFSKYVHSKNCVAFNSATSALHSACLALGVGKGDIVWTSPNSFVASSNCALYCGAEVDFVDINEETYNIDLESLETKLEKAKQEAKLPKVLIPVHFSGLPCNLKEIFDLSKKYGFEIIEDASHAIGTKYQGEMIGNCKYSKIAVFSLHPVKIITAGEGGLATTNDPEIYERLKLIRSHGVTRESSLLSVNKKDPTYYEQISIGYNYRMTDINAALAVSQLKKVNQFIKRRHEISLRYDNELKDLPIRLPKSSIGEDYESATHLYVIRLNLVKLKLNKLEIINSLRDKGIILNVHYIPIHTQPFYQSKGFNVGDFQESERYYEEALSIPIYPLLTDDEQTIVIESMAEVLLRL